jgi:hypothetical protein
MISIDWGNKIINVPRAYLTQISGSLYELDVNQFRLDLRDLEDSDAGMAFVKTHIHNTSILLSGVTYARTVEIINGYTITFEELPDQYTVRCVGANHNLADVLNFNGVTLVIGNAAGLITIETGSGLSSQQATQLLEIYRSLMLDKDVPVRTTPEKIEFGSVEIDLTGDPETEIIGTRRP